jgi:transglutaminase-like putative cysteine protease/tetratricopeptide (TPR) repeat protein
MSVKSCFVALLLLAGLAFSPLFAQEKPANKPSEQPSVPAPDFSKEALIIERFNTKTTAENDGTGSREVSAEIRMLAEAGVKAFAVLDFTYTSANEEVEIVYVRVRKPDGTIVKTPDYNIQDMPGEVTRTAPLYSDIHEKHVAVKGLGVGDVLEYQVRYRIVKPLVPGHFWEEYEFTKGAIAKDEQLEINVPSGKYVKVVSPDFKPEIKEEGGRRIYHWTHANLVVKEKDPNEVPRRIPPNPDVQLTTFASWEEVGRWYGGLQKDPLEVTAAIKAKAAELTKGLTTDDEKIHAIYNFVSLKFHYIGLDFGIGRYQPHAADDVLDNGYGDCKDKHTLLASLLKAAGIDAYPVLIHATRKLDPDVPSPAQFNHVITVVPRGDKYLWMDTTPEVAPYGLLLITLRNKQALVIPTDGVPVLAMTPANPPFEDEQKFSTEGKLGADGTFSGHIEQSYLGDTAVMLRSVFRQVSQSQWKEAVQRFSYGLNFGGEVSNVTMTSPEDIDRPFQLSYDYVRKDYADWEHKQIMAPLPPMGGETVKGDRQKKPEEPVLLSGLGKVTYHSRMELPPGYSASSPAKCHLVESYAEYTAETKIEKGVMTTDRELLVKKNEVPLSDWDAYRAFGLAMSDDEFNYIRLRGGDATVYSFAKDPADIEAKLRDTLKADPKNSQAAAALAAMLSLKGQDPEAIKVLEPAVNAAPNPDLELQLGQLYLNAGQNEKGLNLLHQAVQEKDDDPGVLNNAAYMLAEKKLNLDSARQYAESAIDELDDQAQKPGRSEAAGLNLTYLYSLVWDTLGWVHFQQGDAKGAESLVRAAWLLGEESLVGEHLGEIYEKEGKTELAARTYEYALTVASVPYTGFGMASEGAKQFHKQNDEIRARYKKMMGKDVPLAAIRRLPNGQWTQTPAEQLLHSREVKIGNDAKLSGAGWFSIEIKSDKVDSVQFLGGDDELKSLEKSMTAAHYPLEFPPDSEAILVLRLSVKCEPKTPCVVSFINPVPAQSPFSSTND